MSRRQVMRTIDTLLKTGLITRTHRSTPKGRTTNLYILSDCESQGLVTVSHLLIRT
jgi:predicted transcriptional regulator